MYKEYNPNPIGLRVGDCAVRAVAKALGIDWGTAYLKLLISGFQMGDLPSSDNVWSAVLRKEGFYRKAIPDTCPDCYTAADFCEDYPNGTYVLSFGGHVATVQDGDLYDSWDSSNLVPQYYWYKEDLSNGLQ
jgi:hypothetical protein